MADVAFAMGWIEAGFKWAKIWVYTRNVYMVEGHSVNKADGV